MAFRFFKRVKIAPGLSINLSKGGASLSAGPRGAKFTVGSRGVRTTVGPPGTGLYWSKHKSWGSKRRTTRSKRSSGSASALRGLIQEHAEPTVAPEIQQISAQDASIRFEANNLEELAMIREQALRMKHDPRIRLADPETGRSLSVTQIEAKIRKAEKEILRKEKEKAQQDKVQQAQQQAEEQEALLMDLVDHWKDLPSIPEWEECVAATEVIPFSCKTPPAFEVDWEHEQNVLRESIEASLDVSMFGRLKAFKSKSAEIEERFAQEWPAREQELQQDYQERYDRYVAAWHQQAEQWQIEETARIEHLQRLLASDLEAIHETAVNAVETLEFPFETSCEIFVEEYHTIWLHLDLPEIEDTIPLKKTKVKKNGDLQEINRKALERNNLYFDLTMGQLVFMAAAVFNAIPTAYFVHVAAYTQRPRKKESDPVDTYVVDARFAREAVAAWDVDSELLPQIRSLSPVMDLKTNGALGKIDKPSWIPEE